MAEIVLNEADRLALAEDVARLVLDAVSVAAENGGDWMDSTRAAEYLGMTRAALDKKCTDPTSEIPFNQDAPGGKRWFKPSHLDEWRCRSY